MAFIDIFSSEKRIQKRIDKAVVFAVERALKDKTTLKSIYDPSRAFQETQFKPADRRDFLQLYETYTWVYACVFAIATNGAKVPYRLFHRKPNGEKGDEVLSGWPWTLFNRPNPLQSNFDFNEALISSLELTGTAFVEKDNEKKPTQMYVMRPDFVEIIGNKETLVDKFIYDVNGSITKFNPEEIVHFKYFHPRSELYGLSPINPATNSIVMDLFAITYSKNFFKQGGQLSMYLKVPNELQDDEFTRLREQVRTMYGGVDRSHLIGILDNDAEFKEVGNSPANALLMEQREMNRDEVMAIFNVPPIMLSLVSDITYNNGGEQKTGFWENKMQPTLRKISDKWNIDFLEDNGFMGEYDFSDIAALQGDQEKKATTATKLVEGRIFTPNEARKKFYQMEETDGGEALNPVKGSPAQELMEAAKFLKTHAPGHRFDQEFGPQTNSIESKLASLMREFEAKVLSNITRLQKSEVYIQKDMISEAFTDMDELESLLLTLMEEENINAGVDFFKNKYLALSGGVVPNEVLIDITKQLEAQIGQWAKLSKGQITKTIEKDLISTLEAAIKNDDSVDEITKRIQDIFRGTDRATAGRARRIAKTEMLKIGNHSNTLAAKTLGFTEKIWVADGPPNDRQNHTGINGERVPIDGTFSIGLKFPGDPTAPASQIVGCDCTLDYA